MNEYDNGQNIRKISNRIFNYCTWLYVYFQFGWYVISWIATWRAHCWVLYQRVMTSVWVYIINVAITIHTRLLSNLAFCMWKLSEVPFSYHLKIPFSCRSGKSRITLMIIVFAKTLLFGNSFAVLSSVSNFFDISFLYFLQKIKRFDIIDKKINEIYQWYLNYYKIRRKN